MDQRVEDVYAENAKFDNLLQSFYKTRDDKILKEIWPIMFRCASNVLKKKFGSYESFEWIIDKALDICELIQARIHNFEKYPNGYVIKNLPTCVSYAVLNVVYGNKQPEEDPYGDSPKRDRAVYEDWSRNYWTGNTWEDEILDSML